MKLRLLMFGFFGSMTFPALLVGCTQTRSGDTPGSLAPYRHVIRPAPDRFFEQERALKGQIQKDSGSFLKAAGLAALYAQEAKVKGDLELFNQAEREAKRSIALFPIFNDRAYLVLADVAQARHEFNKSIQLSEKLIRSPLVKRGAKIEAYSLLITAEVASGKLEDAHRDADRLVNLDPSVMSHLLRALVLEGQGRDNEVLYDYQTAYQQEVFGSPAEAAKLRTFWGRFYFRRGEYLKAKGLWEEALRILPEDHLAIGLMADLELRVGKYADAERDAEKAFRSSKQTVYLLSEIEAKRGLHHIAEAEELQNQVEKLLRHSLESVDSRYAHRNELAKLLLARGNPGDAREALNLLRDELAKRRSADTLFLAATALERVGNLPSAEETMQELLRTGVKQAEYYSLAAEIENQLHQDSRARFYLNEAGNTDARFDPSKNVMSSKRTRVAVQ